MFDLEDYNYDLPPELIAQEPVPYRDQSRLMVLDCRKGEIVDTIFKDIVDLFKPGDLLVVNDTKVFPARILGNKETGGKVELFILGYPSVGEAVDSDLGSSGQVEVDGLVKSSKGVRPGTELLFGRTLSGTVLEKHPDGKVRVRLRVGGDFDEVLGQYGMVPLPPYIRRGEEGRLEDKSRYQTVYAKESGAVAAPTAGLHFTEELLGRIRDKGCGVVGITLHVGYGTFSPVRVRDIRQHEIHQEYYEISPETAGEINRVKAGGGAIWIVGTTTARAVEAAADANGIVQPTKGWCDIYIFPGYDFKVVKNLITNFHLPKSSLLFLVSALGGRQRIFAAYDHAIREGYRFYSYGDAMVVLTG